ncbi:MAG: secretion protein HlyD [Negativicutes bacterium]
MVQIFQPIKEINRTHSRAYAKDFLTPRGQKRCAKMAGGI